jgi:hypothetical protein
VRQNETKTLEIEKIGLEANDRHGKGPYSVFHHPAKPFSQTKERGSHLEPVGVPKTPGAEPLQNEHVEISRPLEASKSTTELLSAALLEKR